MTTEPGAIRVRARDGRRWKQFTVYVDLRLLPKVPMLVKKFGPDASTCKALSLALEEKLKSL